RAHVVRPSAYHIGNTGRSRQRILQERELREALETQADSLVGASQGKSAQQLAAELQQFVHSNPNFAWVSNVGPRETLAEKLIAYARLASGGIVFLVLLPILPIEIILLLALRYKESRDEGPSGAADLENLRNLVQRE